MNATKIDNAKSNIIQFPTRTKPVADDVDVSGGGFYRFQMGTGSDIMRAGSLACTLQPSTWGHIWGHAPGSRIAMLR